MSKILKFTKYDPASKISHELISYYLLVMIKSQIFDLDNICELRNFQYTHSLKENTSVHKISYKYKDINISFIYVYTC